eukprot:364474-Chlamydomonas_euryale.AAC.2
MDCMGCMGCMEQHELDGAAWSCKELHELDGAAWGCMDDLRSLQGQCQCQSLPRRLPPWQLPPLPPPVQAASPDQAALRPPPPLPAAPPHPPATFKAWCPDDGVGKPSLHMCTSASCPKRPTRERLYAVGGGKVATS